jgi:hypothetical protein
MIVGLVDGVVGAHEVPGSVRELSSLPDPDYVDLFTLSTDIVATPERWARAMFGDVPSATELLIWRGLLGLRLYRGRSSATVAGWRIGGLGEDWIRLEAASWFLTANLLVHTADGRVALWTFLRYDRALGRVVWPPLSAIHRRVVPGVLRGVAARVAIRSRRSERAGGGDSGRRRPARPRGHAARTGYQLDSHRRGAWRVEAGSVGATEDYQMNVPSSW